MTLKNIISVQFLQNLSSYFIIDSAKKTKQVLKLNQFENMKTKREWFSSQLLMMNEKAKTSIDMML